MVYVISSEWIKKAPMKMMGVFILMRVIIGLIIKLLGDDHFYGRIR